MKTNQAHRKGGKSKAIPQGQSKSRKSTARKRQSSAFLRLVWPIGMESVEIRLGADANAELYAARLTVEDLQQDLDACAEGMQQGQILEVDYRRLISTALGLRQLAAILGFKPEELAALKLLSQWWGQPPLEYMRELSMAGLECVFDEMKGWATQSKGFTHCEKSTEFARRYYPKALALRPEGGWK